MKFSESIRKQIKTKKWKIGEKERQRERPKPKGTTSKQE